MYLAGWSTTRFGKGVEETAVLWVVYDLTDSPALLGLLGLFRAVPSILLSPIAGAVADRIDQRKILFVTQSLGLVASLTAGILIVTSWVEVWQLYLLVGYQATIEAFDGGARQALFPRLVPMSVLPDAVTMNATAGRGMMLVGPVVGGIAIGWLGEAAPFFINAASFPALMLAVALIRSMRPVEPSESKSLVSDMWESLRYIARAPVLRGLLLLEIVVGIVQINSVIITVFGRQILDVGPEGLGGLLAAPALGAVLALFGLLGFGHAGRQGRFALVCGIVYSAALVLLAGSVGYALAFAVLTIIGLMDGFMTVTRHSILQLVAPGQMRGRIMGWMGTITRGVSPVGEMQSGFVSGLVGPSLALIAAGSVLGLAVTATAVSNRPLWRFRQQDAIAAQPDQGIGGSPLTGREDHRVEVELVDDAVVVERDIAGPDRQSRQPGLVDRERATEPPQDGVHTQ
jgi:Transmembrane secretion effector